MGVKRVMFQMRVHMTEERFVDCKESRRSWVDGDLAVNGGSPCSHADGMAYARLDHVGKRLGRRRSGRCAPSHKRSPAICNEQRVSARLKKASPRRDAMSQAVGSAGVGAGNNLKSVDERALGATLYLRAASSAGSRSGGSSRPHFLGKFLVLQAGCRACVTPVTPYQSARRVRTSPLSRPPSSMPSADWCA